MKATKFTGLVAGIALLAGAISTPVGAASATANLSVTATVISNCTISTAAVAFGNYDPVGANAAADLDSTGTVTIACTKGVAPTVGLGLGANSLAGARRMFDGTAGYLTYELYQEVGRVTVWSNAGGGLVSPGAAPSKAARNLTVYGRVASNQDATAGNYTDTVVATVNF